MRRFQLLLGNDAEGNAQELGLARGVAGRSGQLTAPKASDTLASRLPGKGQHL